MRCDLNGHVFPSAGAFNAVSKFMEGPKFKKLIDKKKTEVKLDKMDPFLVPSRNFPERMWCALTKQLVAAGSQDDQEAHAGEEIQECTETVSGRQTVPL